MLLILEAVCLPMDGTACPFDHEAAQGILCIGLRRDPTERKFCEILLDVLRIENYGDYEAYRQLWTVVDDRVAGELTLDYASLPAMWGKQFSGSSRKRAAVSEFIGLEPNGFQEDAYERSNSYLRIPAPENYRAWTSE